MPRVPSLLASFKPSFIRSLRPSLVLSLGRSLMLKFIGRLMSMLCLKLRLARHVERNIAAPSA